MMAKKNYFSSERLQRPWCLAIAVGFFFMAGLWLFFPVQALQLRLEQELGQQFQRPVTVGEVRLRLPATLAVDSLDTTLIPNLALQLTKISARPMWLHLVQGNPAVALRGTTLGGTITAELDSRHHIQLFATNLRWNQPLPQFEKIQLNTTIEQFSASGFSHPINQLEQLQLQLAMVEVTGLKQFSFPIDQLNLGRVELQLSQNGQQIEIDQLSSTGGDLNLSGRGSLILLQNLPRSKLDITLNLIPNKSLSPALSSLLSLFAKQQSQGGYLIHIGGTFAQPRLL